MQAMSKEPTESERRKLQKATKFYQRSPAYSSLCLALILLVNVIFKNKPTLSLVVDGLLILVLLGVLLRYALLRRCPRCQAFGTPVMGGNCSSCGLHLDGTSKQVV